MRYDTKIEGLTLDEFDAWLRRDWAICIFTPAEWHGHPLDTPAPVKIEALPKTLVQAGYVFTRQAGYDTINRVGWVYAEKTAKVIRVEADIQPPHALNFAQWIQDRFGVTAKEQPDADTRTAYAGTPEKVQEAHRLREQRIGWKAIRQRVGIDPRTYKKWCKEFTGEEPR